MAAWIIATQWASRLILVILLGLSVWSVAIMLERRRIFAQLTNAAEILARARALIQSRNWQGLSEWTTQQTGAIYAGTLRAALDTGSRNPDQIERSVKSYLVSKRAELENGLTTLATLGSNAPFIGLFGTVLGIIQAFGALGTNQSGTASVMTAISEALIATAVGLFVAIPAVVAYNVFSRKLRLVLSECESLRDFYISRIEG